MWSFSLNFNIAWSNRLDIVQEYLEKNARMRTCPGNHYYIFLSLLVRVLYLCAFHDPSSTNRPGENSWYTGQKAKANNTL